MKSENYSITLLGDKTPEEVYKLATAPRAWWTGYYSEKIDGNTEKLNDEFTFRAGDGAHYTKQKLVEVISNKKIVWLVTECKLAFAEKKDEWVGTKIILDISKEGSKTKLVFTHEGLIPERECYDSCAPAWTQYLQNRLLPLMTQAKL